MKEIKTLFGRKLEQEKLETWIWKLSTQALTDAGLLLMRSRP